MIKKIVICTSQSTRLSSTGQFCGSCVAQLLHQTAFLLATLELVHWTHWHEVRPINYIDVSPSITALQQECPGFNSGFGLSHNLGPCFVEFTCSSFSHMGFNKHFKRILPLSTHGKSSARMGKMQKSHFFGRYCKGSMSPLSALVSSAPRQIKTVLIPSWPLSAWPLYAKIRKLLDGQPWVITILLHQHDSRNVDTVIKNRNTNSVGGFTISSHEIVARLRVIH